MSKIAFVFPGQGSQTVGMMKEFYDKYTVVRELFAEADDALGFSLSTLCFAGPEEDLRLTYNTQPAILTASVAAMKVLRQNGVEPAVAAGHSLGEYSALVAAEALSFTDAVRIVRKRGRFMQEAVPVGEGAMAAVMGLDSAAIIACCQKAEAESGKAVQAVNFNCPGQVVIAGAVEGVDAAIKELKASGAKRAIPLPVSAPFHSTLMKPAAERLDAEFKNIVFKDAKLPVIANVSAQAVTKAADIEASLVRQAASPVLWEESVRNMVASGVDTFIEVGPGKVLTGFTKKIAKGMAALNVEDEDSIEKTLAYLKEVR